MYSASCREQTERESVYLLDFFDFMQLDDFVPLGGSRLGAGALETQMTEETEESQLTPRSRGLGYRTLLPDSKVDTFSAPLQRTTKTGTGSGTETGPGKFGIILQYDSLNFVNIKKTDETMLKNIV